MALGICEGILEHMARINPQNYAGNKVTNNGFTNMLLATQEQPNLLGEAYTDGHRREQRIKYKVPVTEKQVQTAAGCGVDVVPAYKETTTSINNYVQVSLHVTDDIIRQYCKDASDMAAMPSAPPTRVMNELYDSMLHAMRGLYAKMERTLTAKMALNFGKNAVTGSNASRNVNFNLNGTTQNFQEGLTRILTDVAINEICGTPAVVGNGNIHGFAMNYMANAYGLNQYGLDQNRLADALGFNFYHSQMTASTWGDNQFGLFSPGSAHLIQNVRYVGSFANDFGVEKNFTIIDPRVQCWTPSGLQSMQWDVKMIRNGCDEAKTGGYLGNATYGEGWQMIISKYYDLFVVPTDGYDGADVLAGNNGTLRYTATNA